MGRITTASLHVRKVWQPAVTTCGLGPDAGSQGTDAVI